MPSALDVLAAAIGSQQVDDCHVVVSTLGSCVESLLRRDAFEDEFEDEDEVDRREDNAGASATTTTCSAARASSSGYIWHLLSKSLPCHAMACMS